MTSLFSKAISSNGSFGLFDSFFGKSSYVKSDAELFPDKINSVSYMNGDAGTGIVATNQWVGSLVGVTNGKNPTPGNVAIGVSFDNAANNAVGVHNGPTSGSVGVSYGVGSTVSVGITTGGNDVLTGAGRGAEDDAGTGTNIVLTDEETNSVLSLTGIETGSVTLIKPSGHGDGPAYGVAVGASIDSAAQGGVGITYSPNGVSIAATNSAGVSGTVGVTVGNGSVIALAGAALEGGHSIMSDYMPKPAYVPKETYTPKPVEPTKPAPVETKPQYQPAPAPVKHEPAPAPEPQTPVRHEPDVVKQGSGHWATGAGDSDYKIAGKSDGWQSGPTEDGHGTVFWKGDEFHIVSGCSKVAFDDCELPLGHDGLFSFPDKINSISYMNGDHGTGVVATSQWVGSLVGVTNGDNPTPGNVAVGVSFDNAANNAVGVHNGPTSGSVGVSYGVGSTVSVGITTGGNDVLTGAGRGAEDDAGTGTNIVLTDEETNSVLSLTGIETGSVTLIKPHGNGDGPAYGVAVGASIDSAAQGGVGITYSPNGVSIAATNSAGVSGTVGVTVGNGSVIALSGAALEGAHPIMADYMPKAYGKADHPSEAQIYDVAGKTQWVNGGSGQDVFVIHGKAADYGYGQTQDGHGCVVWSGANFDILHGVEAIRFDDALIDISHFA